MEEMVEVSQISGNKRMIFFVVLYLFCSCSNSSPERKEEPSDTSSYKATQMPDTSTKENKVKTFSLPDSSVNSKLKLDDYSSLANFYSGRIHLIDSIRESPVAMFCNQKRSQYLLAYQYEGSTKNSFNCFEIGLIQPNDIIQSKCNSVTDEVFFTESGLKLGMSLNSLIAQKGHDYKLSTGDSVITYRMDASNSNFVKWHNMPGYFLECYVKNGNIAKIKFGFEYP